VKKETLLEISKHLEISAKLEELPVIFDGRNKEPTDYRRNGIITIFVGIGLYLAGFV
jgi:hypothetical protein